MQRKFYAWNRISPSVQEWETDLVELERVPTIQMVLRPQNLVALTDAASVGAEKFRGLAVRLKNFQKRQQLRKLLITSSIKGEGKSVISANLAVTLARQAQRVLLVDCDLHQSGLRQVLGSQGELGLSDWSKQSDSVVGFLRRIEDVSLWYLSAGQETDNPVEIFQSAQFSKMLNQAGRWFDWVILDSPPLIPVADSSVLASQVDGTLLIVRRGTTPKPLLQEALKTDGLKLLGVVANEWVNSGQPYYGQYYSAYSTRHDQEPTPQLPNGTPHRSLSAGAADSL
jgi:capsular exopolysaccharide synthesis family protein